MTWPDWQHRRDAHRQPRDRRIDHTTPGFVRPPDPCVCPPCLGRGNDGHGLTHCAECCFGTGVEADIACPVHGLPHAHAWDDLGIGGLRGSVCRLCGETQID